MDEETAATPAVKKFRIPRKEATPASTSTSKREQEPAQRTSATFLADTSEPTSSANPNGGHKSKQPAGTSKDRKRSLPTTRKWEAQTPKAPEEKKARVSREGTIEIKQEPAQKSQAFDRIWMDIDSESRDQKERIARKKAQFEAGTSSRSSTGRHYDELTEENLKLFAKEGSNTLVNKFMERELIVDRILGYKMHHGRVDPYNIVGFVKCDASSPVPTTSFERTRREDVLGSEQLFSHRNDRIASQSSRESRPELSEPHLLPPSPRPFRVDSSPPSARFGGAPSETPGRSEPRPPPFTPLKVPKGPRTPPGSPGPVTPPPSTTMAFTLGQSAMDASYSKDTDKRILISQMAALTGTTVAQVEQFLGDDLNKAMNKQSDKSELLETLRNALRNLGNAAEHPPPPTPPNPPEPLRRQQLVNSRMSDSLSAKMELVSNCSMHDSPAKKAPSATEPSLLLTAPPPPPSLLPPPPPPVHLSSPPPVVNVNVNIRTLSTNHSVAPSNHPYSVYMQRCDNGLYTAQLAEPQQSSIIHDSAAPCASHMQIPQHPPPNQLPHMTRPYNPTPSTSLLQPPPPPLPQMPFHALMNVPPPNLGHPPPLQMSVREPGFPAPIHPHAQPPPGLPSTMSAGMKPLESMGDMPRVRVEIKNLTPQPSEFSSIQQALPSLANVSWTDQSSWQPPSQSQNMPPPSNRPPTYTHVQSTLFSALGIGSKPPTTPQHPERQGFEGQSMLDRYGHPHPMSSHCIHVDQMAGPHVNVVQFSPTLTLRQLRDYIYI
ncbi:unnamed protein product [Caenorhabditis auriculariae]|uniref:Uncharacterized protein n=1 Tax=Caenorhabditis auriculariae TaxID=2777116 RepID=A0A8S1GMU2_9PELO|nr:unnamed protein product [Caenorhabditis auriculariae]